MLSTENSDCIRTKRVWKNVTWSWPLHNLVEKVVSAKVVMNVSRQSTISAHVQHNLVQIDVTSNWADEKKKQNKNPFYGFHSKKKHEPMIIWWHDLEVQSVTYNKTIFIFNCNSKDLPAPIVCLQTSSTSQTVGWNGLFLSIE